jgi:uncharacterized protein YdiU (UPF0061 family)
MNTDNMAISGETIDFGPCAFMEAYDPATVFSAIDEQGRYAYANQPRIAQWNLARFAETLLPLIDADPARAVELATEKIVAFRDAYEARWLERMRAKLGLADAREGDRELAESLLLAMREGEADFTLSFRRLADAAEGPAGEAGLRALFSRDAALDAWLPLWRVRLAAEGSPAAAAAEAMRRANPLFIPRNHRVEEAIVAAIEAGDLAPFDALNEALARPCDDQPRLAALALPARPEERVCRTFCGT